MTNSSQTSYDPAFWRTVVRLGDDSHDPRKLAIADETPLSLIYSGVPYSVMMVTPCDIEDFIIGFSLTEGLVSAPDEIASIQIRDGVDGLIAEIATSGAAMKAVLARRRSMPVRSSCGVCGAEDTDALMRPLRPVTSPALRAEAVARTLAELRGRQTLNRDVHMLHAAAWSTLDGDIILVREDVGRHNALDKLIGAASRKNLNLSDGFCTISSRCSFDMVQKSVAAGIGALVAVSAPTERAVKLAEQAGQTLAALARGDDAWVFTSPDRKGLGV